MRGCLTLTCAPNGAWPGRFTGLRTSRSRPFRYTAHAANVAGWRMSFAHSNRSGWRMVLGAVSGIETSSLRDSTGQRALRAPRTAESWCSERNPAAPSRSWRRASPGTVWPAHSLTRQLCARFTPLHEPLCRQRGRFAAFRRSQTAETGGKGVRCPGGNSVRAASFRFAALHETVRTHSKLPAMG